MVRKAFGGIGQYRRRENYSTPCVVTQEPAPAATVIPHAPSLVHAAGSAFRTSPTLTRSSSCIPILTRSSNARARAPSVVSTLLVTNLPNSHDTTSTSAGWTRVSSASSTSKTTLASPERFACITGPQRDGTLICVQEEGGTSGTDATAIASMVQTPLPIIHTSATQQQSRSLPKVSGSSITAVSMASSSAVSIVAATPTSSTLRLSSIPPTKSSSTPSSLQPSLTSSLVKSSITSLPAWSSTWARTSSALSSPAQPSVPPSSITSTFYTSATPLTSLSSSRHSTTASPAPVPSSSVSKKGDEAIPSQAQPATRETALDSASAERAHPSSGLILGVALGGTISLIVILLLIVFLLRRRRRFKQSPDDAPKLPPVSSHNPLVLPLPASADPQNDGWVGALPRNAPFLPTRPPSHQSAITEAGIRLIPREEPPPLTPYGQGLTTVPEMSQIDRSRLVPLLPARSPLRSPIATSSSGAPKTAVAPSPLVAARLSPSVRSHLRPSRLFPSRSARSRASSYTTFDTRSESVYSLDSSGRRRQSDPFSWQKA